MWFILFPQIYVEIERARLTRILSKMKEDEGNIQEAAKVLQELQVIITIVVILVILFFSHLVIILFYLFINTVFTFF